MPARYTSPCQARGHGRKRLGAEALDAQLARELTRACGDLLAHVCRLQDDRLAAPGEDLADEPVLRADRRLRDGAPVLQRPRAALELVARDGLRVPDPGEPGVRQPVRLEVGAPLERLVRQA